MGNSFGKQLRGTALGSSQQQFWGAAFGSHFGAIDLKNRSFGAIALDSSSGEQLWGAALREQLGGSSFGQLSRTALRNTCFEEQQLLGIYLQGTSGSSFQSQLWVGSCFREHFWEQLWGPALGLWKAASSGAASGTSFGERISGTTLGAAL